MNSYIEGEEELPRVAGKLLWDEAVEAYVIVQPIDAPAAWIPDPDNETMIGRLNAETYNQRDGFAAAWSVSTLPISLDDSREVGFIPGLTHSAYSHFRTLITEKWGVIVSEASRQRWAGLLPPVIIAALPFVTGDSDWLIDGNSVMYRAFYSIESTDPDLPYESWGPVSSPVAIYGMDALSAGSVGFALPEQEPLPWIPSGAKLYLNIYRSSQIEVETWQDIPFDFRLVHKAEITDAILAAGTYVFTDSVIELGRAHGEPLYTNATEFGEQSNGFCPPSSRDVTVYRDTAFYANRASLPSLSVSVPGPSVFSNPGLFSDADRERGIGMRQITAMQVTNASTAFTITNANERLGIVPGTIFWIGSFVGVVATFNSGTGAGTFTEPYPLATAMVQCDTFDAFTIKVYYADGTTETASGPVAYQGLDVTSGTYDAIIPSLRIYNVQNTYPLPGYNVEFTWLLTFPAIKRVVQFELYLTNGENYSPAYTGDYATLTNPLISLGDNRPNRLFFSRTGHPEAVPLLNYQDIGAGTILKSWPTQSALLILCTDGLWRLTGDDAPWQVNQVDPTVILVHPDCMGSLNNEIYAWVDDGLALVNEDGSKTISTDAVGQDIRSWRTELKKWGGPYVWGPALAGDQYWNEVWLNIRRAAYFDGEVEVSDEFLTTLIYNSDTKNFTRQQATSFMCVLYSPDANRMITVSPPGPDDPADYIFNVTVQTDFGAEGIEPSYQPVTIWFNALQTEDKGKLKQWMDVNYFVANVVDDPANYLHGLFNARNESFDPYGNDFTVNTRNMEELSRDIHFWVPRRAALSDQLQIGLQAATVDDFEVIPVVGFYFQLQGFTVRYRNASDTLKR